MCFYNLIPVCGSCNHVKHEKDLYRSPYEIPLESVDTFIRFGYTPVDADFIRDFRKIKIEISEEHTGDDSYKKLLGLTDHYQTHRDVVYDLLKKHQMYDSGYLKQLTISLGGLFNDKNEMKRVIWGNYTSKDELHKRPLAKLTRDILRDIDPNLLDD